MSQNHDHPHHHGHDHGHDHSDHAHDHRHYTHAVEWQQAGVKRQAFILGAVLNIGFVIIEYITGWLTGSVALMADASHNLTDVMGLLMAFAAVKLAAKVPTSRYTYGMGSATILAALGNGLLLVFISGALTLESFDRLMSPQPVVTMPVIFVALIGALINFMTARLFHGHNHDVNTRGVYIHMLGDAAISVAVAVGAIIIKYTGAAWVDPLLGLVIVLAILASTWGLLRESIDLALQGVPKNVDAHAVKHYLAEQPGVSVVHDMHIWGLSTTETALTAHLVMPEGHPGDSFIENVTRDLAEKFGIIHATIQIETSPHHVGCSIDGTPDEPIK